MKIKLAKSFDKDFKKLTPNQKNKFKQRKNLFIIDEFSSILNNHSLRGNYKGYRSINITGDLRAIYKYSSNIIVFVAINSHSNLYK